MNAPQQPPEWPPPWARTLAFFVGMGLMVWEAVLDRSSHLIVYGPAFALTGLPVARGIEVLANKLPWGPNSSIAPPITEPPPGPEMHKRKPPSSSSSPRAPRPKKDE